MGRLKTPAGRCGDCGRHRWLRTVNRCSGCARRQSRHRPQGPQTVLPCMLHSGDVLLAGEYLWELTAVELFPCPVSPKVRVLAKCLPDGPFQALLLDADQFVPVQVRHTRTEIPDGS